MMTRRTAASSGSESTRHVQTGTLKPDRSLHPRNNHHDAVRNYSGLFKFLYAAIGGSESKQLVWVWDDFWCAAKCTTLNPGAAFTAFQVSFDTVDDDVARRPVFHRHFRTALRRWFVAKASVY